jgi:Uma2 family endonuclease
MTIDERERFLETVNAALSDPRLAMTEGRPHKKAKTRALDLLGLHFRALGRVVYLAEEMAVVYPGEESFSPDVLAVVGVEEPADDLRMAWVVADEDKGLDFVLDVLHHGDRKKDLVDNVVRYARLGIPEYFIYDRGRQQIHGHRLTGDRYERIVPQGGRYSSAVLGLDLAVQGDKLRFFQGMAELFGTDELIDRLTGMLTDLEAKAEASSGRAAQAVAGLRTALISAMVSRRLEITDEMRARVAECDDPAVLQAWLIRALDATSAAEVLDG